MPHIEPRSHPQNFTTSGRLVHLSAGPRKLFVYGSLQFPEVLTVLIGRAPDAQPADLDGWNVVSLRDRTYPGIVKGSGIAHGFVLEGLSDEEWAIIDAFEDDSYALDLVTLTDGRQALAYICAANGDALLDEHKRWDAGEFAERALAAYLSQCQAWKSRHGRQS